MGQDSLYIVGLTRIFFAHRFLYQISCLWLWSVVISSPTHL